MCLKDKQEQMRREWQKKKNRLTYLETEEHRRKFLLTGKRVEKLRQKNGTYILDASRSIMQAWLASPNKRDSNPIRSLAGCVHPVNSTRRLLLMLRAYCDESYQNGRIYTVCGYLGMESAWESFQDNWQIALEEENVPFQKNSSYRVFHAADCEGGYDVYQGIDRSIRQKMQKRFADVIGQSTIFGFATGIVLGPYEKIETRIKAARGKYSKPYFLAFQHNIELIAEEIQSIPPEERISFVFDRNKELSGSAHEIYNSLIESPSVRYRSRLGGLAFEDKAIITPLQAADYFAYENFRYLRDVRYGNKKERWQWKELHQRPTYGRLFDTEQLDNLIKAVNW